VNVEFLISRADTRSAAIIEHVVREIDFSLVKKGEPNPWGYAQHHCGTGANVYSDVHWSFFESAGAAVPPEVRAEFRAALETEAEAWIRTTTESILALDSPASIKAGDTGSGCRSSRLRNSMNRKTSHPYPVRKQRDLSEEETRHIRQRIEMGEIDIYKLAEEVGCSPSQVAGVKASLHR
jgi:hypothetical protein